MMVAVLVAALVVGRFERSHDRARATGWGIGGTVVVLGIVLNGLCRSLYRRLLLMRDLEVARNAAEDAAQAKSDLLREVSQTNRLPHPSGRGRSGQPTADLLLLEESRGGCDR
jgi:hypothetical protein